MGSQSLVPTAARTALGIPELLHMILMYIDERTLITSAQRVNHFWHSSVADSVLVQRKLFFRADYELPLTRNPFLIPPFWDILELLVSQGRQMQYLTVSSEGYQMPFSTAQYLKREAFAHPQASWRRMLTHQPPLHGIAVLADMFLRGLDVSSRWIPNNEEQEGPLPEVRIGDVFQVCYDAYTRTYATNWLSGGVHLGNVPLAIQDMELYFPPVPQMHRELSLTSTPARTVGECDVLVRLHLRSTGYSLW
ncbi:hypothetical protein GGR57DRAFT_498728 [Xylariaceae sp. FL1272]|nr:hypothetical protein GGR57DRAFT_498728 [Xylariaceae sp. FL1272]